MLRRDISAVGSRCTLRQSPALGRRGLLLSVSLPISQALSPAFLSLHSRQEDGSKRACLHGFNGVVKNRRFVSRELFLRALATRFGRIRPPREIRSVGVVSGGGPNGENLRAAGGLVKQGCVLHEPGRGILTGYSRIS